MSFFKQRCLIYANPYEIGLPNALQGQHIRKDATEQMTNQTRAMTRTQVFGISSANALHISYRCQWVELNFFSYMLSNLKFTRLPSLHEDFYSRHDVNSVFFFLYCLQLIPLHNTAVLIKIFRFLKASELEMPRTWVGVLASVRLFICSIASFLMCCPCEALKGPIS